MKKNVFKTIHHFLLLNEQIINYVLYAVLFFMGLNFLNTEKYFALILFGVVLIKSIVYKKAYLSLSLFLSILLGLYLFASISFYSHSFSLENLGYYLVIPIIFSLLGMCFTHGSNQSFISNLEKLILCFTIGYFTGGLINMIATLLVRGLTIESRYYLNFLGSGKFTLSTALTPSLILATILPILSIFRLFSRKNNREKRALNILFVIASVIAAVFSIFALITLGNRAIVLIFITSYLSILFIIPNSKFKKILVVSFFSLFALFLIIYFLVLMNAFSLQDIIIKNNFLYRLFSGGSNEERMAIYRQFFTKFIRYPLGGMFLSSWYQKPNGDFGRSYVHNTWLDMYLYGGIFAFLIFLFLTVLFIVHLVAISRDNKAISLRIKIVFLPVTFCIFSYFLLEPAMMSNPYFFGIIFFLFSSIERIYLRYHIKSDKTCLDKNTRVLIISNHMSIHMVELHKQLAHILSDNYLFCALKDINQEHRIYDKNLSCLNTNIITLGDSSNKKLSELVKDFNVIIYGNLTFKQFLCIHKNWKHKKYFKLAERVYKESLYEMYNPLKMVAHFIHFVLPNHIFNDNLLTLSAYAYYDFSCLDCFCNRSYQFGYFIKTLNDKFDSQPKDSNRTQILFVNRMINWKRPLDMVELASRLSLKYRNFALTMIGSGCLEDRVKKEVQSRHMEQFFRFLKNESNDSVRKIMSNSDILISASNQKEGWGASVLEGMSSGCLVISSNMTGSAKTVIRNGINGFVYKCGDIDDLFAKVEAYILNKDKFLPIRHEAYNTINNWFNAKNGATALINLIKNSSGISDKWPGICTPSLINCDLDGIKCPNTLIEFICENKMEYYELSI